MFRVLFLYSLFILGLMGCGPNGNHNGMDAGDV